MTKKNGEAAGFIKASPLLVFLLTAVSGGIYLPIWFLRRRKAFNALRSREKLNKSIFVVTAAGFACDFLFGLYAGFLSAIASLSGNEPTLLVTWLNLAVNLVALALLIPLIAQTFKAKRILSDHLNDHLGKNEPFSTLWTVLLLNAYLQHKINGLLADS